jgi:hypothetical protein
MPRARIVLVIVMLAFVSTALWNSLKPLPAGTHVASLPARLSETDIRPLETPEEILAHQLADIDRAAQMIVLDELPIARPIGQRLLLAKRRRPNLTIVVVADRLDEAFGGTPREYLESLEQSGVIVARTRLDRLRDPSPLYTALWRVCCAWWSDPFDEPPDGLRAALRRWNFKGDHRELLVADDGSGGWISLLPAGPGGNLALEIAGAPARDIAASELAIAAWSTGDDRLPRAPAVGGVGVGSIDARFLSEGAIRGALLEALGAASAGDEISVSVRILSERHLIGAALAAAGRGARVAVLLDPNAASNRVVAAELQRESSGRIALRWQSTPAGPNPVSLVLVRRRRELWAVVSAAELSRPALGDLNLAAAAELRLPERAAAARALSEHFGAAWTAAAPYARYADESRSAYWRYRLFEAAGIAAF